MVASGARLQLVSTFNEWGEGTAVESADEWASDSGRGTYLDILRRHLVRLGPSPTATASATPTPPAGTDPVVAAAGDIACAPEDSNFNAGLGSASNCRQKWVSDLILAADVDAVLPLGDLQYEDASLARIQASYDLSWGRLKSITRPVVGNHEYLTPGAVGYYTYFGAAAGDPERGYYSYDLGSWHVATLNSNCSEAGGCGPGSPQESWLRSDLAAHPTTCTLAAWHHPRFSSGRHGDSTATAALWQALQDHGADVVLSGHDHLYERFAPMRADGTPDATRGLREFVVGTGGRNHVTGGPPRAGSEVLDATTFGALFLTLGRSDYAWQFVAEGTETVRDSGRAPCH
jgi:hypothetical protein